MATIRLIPSTYYLSSSTYLTVSNDSNMYNNTDNTSIYTTVQNTRTGTSNYYIYIRGFNFSSIPNNAIINSFTVKFRAKESGVTTSTNYRPMLCNGTTTITGTANMPSTSSTVISFTGVTTDWNTIVGYGTNFGIRINCRRASRNTTGYMYIYGAEILVDYTLQDANVTGVSVSPTTASIEAGDTVTLTPTVSPSNAANKNVTWSSNNTSVATVSNGVVTGVSAGTAVITVTTVDGGYTATCTVTVTAAVTYDYVLTTSLQVGKKYLIANGNTGAVYLLSNESGGSRQLVGVAATVSNNRITINTTTKNKAEFECVRYTAGNDITITVMSDNKYLYTDNSTGLRLNSPTTLDRFWHYQDNKFWQFKSTSTNGYTDTSSEYKYYLELNSSNNYTDNHVTSPSIADTNIPSMYIYVEDDGSSQQQDTAYFKVNGTWRQVSQIYKKINGTWVLQTDYDNVFTTGTKYKT